MASAEHSLASITSGTGVHGYFLFQIEVVVSGDVKVKRVLPRLEQSFSMGSTTLAQNSEKDTHNQLPSLPFNVGFNGGMPRHLNSQAPFFKGKPNPALARRPIQRLVRIALVPRGHATH